ncbi:hypothetical protein [Halorientalis litorea]|uniref:hypothetical protein n=1 Tax=Halorientalis litorea TaxID=2931977 RepID=UPI001FF47FD6|nr:hypothetical protein [Halorientalis litorea]
MSVRETLGSQRVAAALVVVGVALLVAPALVPVQPVLSHDTGPGTFENESQMAENGYTTVIAYENLSARGQELYVSALENGGRYTVPVGQGAPEFSYPTAGELGEIDDFEEQRALHSVVVERPPDADLPPADEPVERVEDLAERREEYRERAAEEGEATPEPDPDRPSLDERRQQTARYDVMSTETASPPLTATGPLVRLLSACVGIVAIGVGGYRRSLP